MNDARTNGLMDEGMNVWIDGHDKMTLEFSLCLFLVSMLKKFRPPTRQQPENTQQIQY